MSIFWCAAYVALQVAAGVPGGPSPASTGIMIFAVTLALICIVIWIATIYLVRAELHYHYNQREPVGLYLSGVMTFFFSFLYFQYHLYKIAQLRERYGDKPFYYQGGPPLDIQE
jgi:Na+/H+-translocating membrane pyrophosphatase